MPRFVVSLRRLNRPVACCGATPQVHTHPNAGTVVHVDHGRFCRVGRVLSGPMPQTNPGYEPLPVDDRRTVKHA